LPLPSSFRISYRRHPHDDSSCKSTNSDRVIDINENLPYPLDEQNRPMDHGPIPLQTPHAGRHFTPTHPGIISKKGIPRHRGGKRNGRFTEGWYYRLTLPEINESFVFIFSIEDPGRRKTRKNKGEKDLTLACMQIMGPNDTYLVQSDQDDTKFWAWKKSQGLGCTFQWNDDDNDDNDNKMITAMTPHEWNTKVKSGFQVLPYHLQGKLIGHDGSLGGVLDGMGLPGTCEFDLKITYKSAWGDSPPIAVTSDTSHDTETNNMASTQSSPQQLSTAGWLASYPVFEPHWQVTMADAYATGTVKWYNQTYTVTNAPFYGEKNWGGSFPLKWYWIQCNSFTNYNHLSVTAGGGRRQLPFMIGKKKKTEDLGLIGIHYNQTFYELVPWTGKSNFVVHPWGYWELNGQCTSSSGFASRQFDVELIAKIDDVDAVPGVLLRAPTEEEGMVYFARDTYYANITLSLWNLQWNDELKEYVRVEPPIVDRAFSSQCAAEVGGGPWWDTWNKTSEMVQPMKGLVRFPYLAQRVKRRIGSWWRRKG